MLELDGDSVLVIGNSCVPTFPDLSTYDVVIRINSGGELAVRQGERCDVWLNNLWYNKSYVPDFVPNCVILRMNYEYGGSRAVRFPKKWVPCTQFWDSDSYNKMVQELGLKRPSSGLMILYFLQQFDADVHIIGYDGYKTANRYTGHTGEGDPHDWGQEQLIIKQWITEGKLQWANT